MNEYKKKYEILFEQKQNIEKEKNNLGDDPNNLSNNEQNQDLNIDNYQSNPEEKDIMTTLVMNLLKM